VAPRRTLAPLLVGAILALAAVGVACGGDGARDPGVGSGSAASVDARPAPLAPLVLRPLGVAALDDLAIGERPGAAAYRRARAAEKVARWDEVVREARAARAVDPTHVAAAWLEAAALARAGKLADVLEPLQVAAAADWARYGERSLGLPLFADFRASPAGAAWIAAADGYRAEFARRAPRAFPVVAGGDVVGLDGDGRWLRLTSTGGRVLGALRRPDGRQLAVVTRAPAPAKAWIVTSIDLVSGASTEVFRRDAKGTLRLRWRGGAVDGASIEWNSGPGGWKTPAGAPAPKAGAQHGPALRVVDDRARLTRVPIAGVAADWDDAGLAGAMRVSRSGAPFTVPPGLFIVGDSVVRSPDGARVAFAAVPLERCPIAPAADGALAPAAAWFVGEVTTARLTQLAPWRDGDQLDWRDDRTLALASAGELRWLAIDGAAAGVAVVSRAPVSLVGRAPTSPCAAVAVPAGELEPVAPGPETDPGTLDDEPAFGGGVDGGAAAGSGSGSSGAGGSGSAADGSGSGSGSSAAPP
jgi:hypothetical protein